MLLCVLLFLLLLHMSSCEPIICQYGSQDESRSDTDVVAERIHHSIFGDETKTRDRHNVQRRSIICAGENVQTFSQLRRMDLESAPATQNPYRPPPSEGILIIEPCQNLKCHISLVVVMDSSGSVGPSNWQTELSFVKALLEVVAVKAHLEGIKVCTGLVTYSTRVHVEVDPCCGNTICRIVDQFNVRKFRYRGGVTNTNGALKVARQMLQGSRSYRKVVILITDGQSNVGGNPVPIAGLMRRADGIDIVALGVTNSINPNELRGISGDHIITKIERFDDFGPLAAKLLGLSDVMSQYELDTKFRAVCSDDRSYFRARCSRECTWGAWSACALDWIADRCQQTRTCKVGSSVAKQKKRACFCPGYDIYDKITDFDYDLDIGRHASGGDPSHVRYKGFEMHDYEERDRIEW